MIFLLGVAAELSRSPSLLVRRLYHGRVRRAPPWDCGFPWQTRAHAGHRRRLRPADPADLRAVLPDAARAAHAVRRAPRYRVDGRGPLLALALPADRARWPSASRGSIGLLQQGRIAVYLLYSFVTLIAMLLVVMR